MDAQLAADGMAAFRSFDGVDVADYVGYRHVGRGKFLDISGIPVTKIDGGLIAEFLNEVATSPADRSKRVIVDLATGDYWNHVVQQRGQLAQDSTLGLAAEAQQDHIVARQNRIDHLPFFPFGWTAQWESWKELRNLLPFGILEIGRVGLVEFGHSPILLDHF